MPGHSLQGPAGSVSGFRSLEEVCGRLRRLLWLVPPAVRPVLSRADGLVCSQHLNRRRGKFRQAARTFPFASRPRIFSCVDILKVVKNRL